MGSSSSTQRESTRLNDDEVDVHLQPDIGEIEKKKRIMYRLITPGR